MWWYPNPCHCLVVYPTETPCIRHGLAYKVPVASLLEGVEVSDKDPIEPSNKSNCVGVDLSAALSEHSEAATIRCRLPTADCRVAR